MPLHEQHPSRQDERDGDRRAELECCEGHVLHPTDDPEEEREGRDGHLQDERAPETDEPHEHVVDSESRARAGLFAPGDES